MRVRVDEVAGGRELLEFIRFPARLHRDCPHYVCPLESERRRFLSPRKNPFFEHASAALFLARDPSGRVVGRITAHVDWNFVGFHGEKTGFFGFFDCVDDPAPAQALLRAAESSLRGRGMEAALGPLHFTTNDEAGLLVEGFNSPPALMMPYNLPYYAGLLEGCGYAKARDLYAYEVEELGRPRPFVSRLADRARRSGRLTLRGLDLRRLDGELALVKEIYNAAWERNWGFVPLTDAEIEHLARNLKPILDPALVYLGFVEGRPAGVFIAVPDYNRVLGRLRGRLLPFGFLRFLRERRRIDRVRVMVLGVKREFRGQGLEVLFLDELTRRSAERGYRSAECSWVLEDNAAMNAIMGRLTPGPRRVYRVYGRQL